MKHLLFVFFALIYPYSIHSQSFEIDTIQYNGNINKHLNLVILGDGYTNSELSKFTTDATKFTNYFFSVTPYTEYKHYFNVFSIKVPSNESGANHPGTATDVSEPVHPIKQVDNYFGSTFDFAETHRLLVATKVNSISDVLANNFPFYDQVIILVNSSFYGGSGGEFATASLEANSNEIALHELGHSFGDLIDEYYAGDIFSREGINMTQQSDSGLVKWKNWISYKNVGVYQHCCGGNSANWYKPHQNCKMENLGFPFCAVCSEGIIEKIHSSVSHISDYYPKTNVLPISSIPITFSVDVIKTIPNTLDIKWHLNNKPFANGVDSIEINNSHINFGLHSVSVSVEDTTQLLRINEHNSIHLSVFYWIIEYSPTGFYNKTSDSFNVDLYPNPTAQKLYVNLSTLSNEEVILELYDLTGSLVKKTQSSGNKQLILDLETIKSGTYILTILLNSQRITSKAIIKH